MRQVITRSTQKFYCFQLGLSINKNNFSFNDFMSFSWKFLRSRLEVVWLMFQSLILSIFENRFLCRFLSLWMHISRRVQW